MTTLHWTARTFLAATLALLTAAALAQATPGGHYPVTPEQRVTADRVAQSGVPLSALAPDAPDRHTVARGDTLWGMAAIFLASPWRWPELWGMNREQVANPHLIYPGQVLRLVKGNGRAWLEVAGGGTTAGAVPDDVIRLSPRTRQEELGADAIPSIPNHLIEPFLAQPVVVDADGLNGFPRIAGTQEGRVYVGRDDTAYASGITDPYTLNYHVFRPAQPLYDPDDTERRRPIAYEAFHLGTARVVKWGPIATVTIVESKQEIGVGDRLIPVERLTLASYVPRAPRGDVAGRVVAVHGGVDYGAVGSIVVLNRGTRAGLVVGDVLALLQTGAVVPDLEAGAFRTATLPDERIGSAFVFRVFDNIAYALIVGSAKPIRVGDRFTPPGGAIAAPALSPAAPAPTVDSRIYRGV